MPLRRRKTRRRVRRVRRVRVKRAPAIAKRVHTFTRYADLNSANWVVTNGGQNGSQLVKTVDGFYLDTGNASATNLSYYSYAIFGTLDMLPDYQEFQGLFDQYKILSMSLRMIPFQTCSTAPGVATQEPLGIIHYSVLDYDDAIPYTADNTGVQKMRERQTFKDMNFFRKPFKRSVKPRIAIASYGAGIFTSYANMKTNWIDAVSPGVEHFGFKGMLECFAPNTAVPNFVWFRPELKVTLLCRDVQ